METEKTQWRQRQRVECCVSKPRNDSNGEGSGRSGSPPRESSMGVLTGASCRNQLCLNLEFSLRAIIEESDSAASSHQLALLFSQPRKLEQSYLLLPGQLPSLPLGNSLRVRFPPFRPLTFPLSSHACPTEPIINMRNGEVPMATTLMPEPRIRTADLSERSGGWGPQL